MDIEPVTYRLGEVPWLVPCHDTVKPLCSQVLACRLLPNWSPQYPKSNCLSTSATPINQPGYAPRASRRVASCKISTSTPSGGSCTYRTTEPRMKQFFTESCIQSTTHVHRMILAFTSHIRKHKKIVHIIMPLPCQKSKSRTRKLIERDFKLFYNVSHNKAEDNNTVHTTYTKAEDMVKT